MTPPQPGRPVANSGLLAAVRSSYRAFTAVGSLLGAASTISGFVTGSAIVFLESAGVIAFMAMMVLVFVFLFTPGRWVERNLVTASAISLILGAVLFFNVGGPVVLAEFDVFIQAVLAVIGLGVFMAIGYFGLSAFQRFELSHAAATKTCPDCANTVLAAARKCQHCGLLFGPPP